MRLKDLKRPRTDSAPYIGILTDSTGDTHYELAISGSSKLIQRVFAESEFEYQIVPKATERNWVPRYQEIWHTTQNRPHDHLCGRTPAKV